ncbi:hypothetical protein C8F04DRAFT_1198143 [Mycena alexandri]|uniref:Uncharacterized protein n=1 Tax=Mycena alexandri TaxID=1745969 RepID=A0AAD6S0N5_9AGAR|nr:hypothetical protein C8F04DRAFT_1198143 [Mycena alexandri]
MSRSAPFIGARAANVDLRTLVVPFVRDGPGLVYSNLHVPTWAFNSWHAGTLSTGAFRHLLEIKAGHTNNFRRRRSQYNRCCRGRFTIIWIAHFWMHRCILLECETVISRESKHTKICVFRYFNHAHDPNKD